MLPCPCFHGELGSLSIEGKALMGLDLPSERENMKYLSGVILENNFLRGHGIFISIRHFLTVARSLTKSVEENGPVYVNPEDLIIVSSKYVHEILNFETHPDHTFSSLINDIAVVLVSIILKKQKWSPRTSTNWTNLNFQCFLFLAIN